MKGNMGDESAHWSKQDNPLYAGQLCVICLRKLHHAIGFNPVQRYEKMLAVLRTVAQSYISDTEEDGIDNSSSSSSSSSSLTDINANWLLTEIQWLERRLAQLPPKKKLLKARIISRGQK
jgi:hypothetical protein